MAKKQFTMTANGFRIGTRGKERKTPNDVAEGLRVLDKGVARQIRKALYAAGNRQLAAVRIS